MILTTLLIALATTPTATPEPHPSTIWCPVCREVMTRVRLNKIAHLIRITQQAEALRAEAQGLRGDLGPIFFLELVQASELLQPPTDSIDRPGEPTDPAGPEETEELQPGWLDRRRLMEQQP